MLKINLCNACSAGMFWGISYSWRRVGFLQLWTCRNCHLLTSHARKSRPIVSRIPRSCRLTSSARHHLWFVLVIWSLKIPSGRHRYLPDGLLLHFGRTWWVFRLCFGLEVWEWRWFCWWFRMSPFWLIIVFFFPGLQ